MIKQKFAQRYSTGARFFPGGDIFVALKINYKIISNFQVFCICDPQCVRNSFFPNSENSTFSSGEMRTYYGTGNFVSSCTNRYQQI